MLRDSMEAFGRQEQDERQRELWRRAAQGWERRQETLREKTAPVSTWLVDAIDPQPGERVVELAAGPGETGFVAARRVGPQGRLLCTDQSPEMVAVARRRAAELGLENVEFAVVDAQRLELEPRSFDAALCRWGYMLMADPDGAMRRTRLALREGGRLALATWDRPDRNLWMAAPVMTAVTSGVLPPPDPSQPSPFALHDADDLERRLRSAGFDEVRIERLGFPQRYASFDEFWAETLDMAAPLADSMAGLTADAAETLRIGTQQMLSEFVAADGRIEVPASTLVAVAEA